MTRFFSSEHEEHTRRYSVLSQFGNVSLGQRFYMPGLDSFYIKVGAHTALEDFGYVTSTAPVGEWQISSGYDWACEVWVPKTQLNRIGFKHED